MDPDVLALVLGRPVQPDDLVPAMLHGFGRVGSSDVVYPRLVPDRTARVPGLALVQPKPHDLVRLTWFEEGEYRPERRTVQLLDGSQVDASMFDAIDTILPAGPSAWCPMSWTARFKRDYLLRCPGWMEGCPGPEVDDLLPHLIQDQSLLAI